MNKLTVAEVLDMFQNGEQRYDTNAYFKEAVNAISAGLPPHVVLDRVLKEHVILMHLHNEELNKNRVAVGVIATLKEEKRDLAENCDRLKDEVASWKDAHQLLTDLVNIQGSSVTDEDCANYSPDPDNMYEV